MEHYIIIIDITYNLLANSTAFPFDNMRAFNSVLLGGRRLFFSLFFLTFHFNGKLEKTKKQ